MHRCELLTSLSNEKLSSMNSTPSLFLAYALRDSQPRQLAR
jgi:hypothetical protein